MSVQVTVQRPAKRAEGRVLIQVDDGSTVALTAAEARELQRGILNAAIEVEHAQRTRRRGEKHRAVVRELRRSSAVDEALRDREGGV